MAHQLLGDDSLDLRRHLEVQLLQHFVQKDPRAHAALQPRQVGGLPLRILHRLLRLQRVVIRLLGSSP